MKLSISNFFKIYLLPFSLVINAVSIDFILGVDDRNLFKILSLALLLTVFISFNKLNKKYIYFIIFSFSFYLSLFFSDFIFNIEDSYKPFARMVASLVFMWVIFSCGKNELEKMLHLYSCLLLFIAVIGLLFLVYPPYLAEKIPVINIYSTKSIVFEQNVYGMSVYFLFLYLFSMKEQGFSKKIIAFLAIFSSYYRTVIALSLMRILLTKLFLPIILIILFCVLYFSNEISLALKLEQVSTLTGRDTLWTIGLVGFSESPLIGNGESLIPYYSNLVLNREPAYTTYHNVLVDILFSGGIVSFLLYLFLIFCVYMKLNRADWVLFSLFLIPSLFNTYYVFSFNILSGFISIWVVLKIKEKDCFNSL